MCVLSIPPEFRAPPGLPVTEAASPPAASSADWEEGLGVCAPPRPAELFSPESGHASVEGAGGGGRSGKVRIRVRVCE